MKIINNTACSQYLRICNKMGNSGRQDQHHRNLHRLYLLSVSSSLLSLCSMSPIRSDFQSLHFSRTFSSRNHHMNQTRDKFLS